MIHHSRRRLVWTTIATVLLASFVALGTAGAASTALQEQDGSGTADDPYVITTAEELSAIDEDPDAHYVLGNDIDASVTADWNGGEGFEPISGNDDGFTGVFDGRNHTITGLTIRKPSFDDVGVFESSTGTIRNVHFAGVTVTGSSRVGAVVGINYGTIRGVSVTGAVTGDEVNVGGIAGWQRDDGRIRQSWTDVSVESSEENAGGLVGNTAGEIVDSYAFGAVEGNKAGGTAGMNNGGIQRVYAVGRVTDVNTGDPLKSGGLVGDSDVIVDAYWNVETSGQSSATGDGSTDGATGLTTGEMTGENSVTSMEALVSRDGWLATDQYPVLQRNVEGLSLDLDTEIVAAGNRTNASVWINLMGDRTRGATTVSTVESADGSVASISNGTITAERTGETTLTATYAGNETSASILVIAAEGISAIGTQTSADEVTAGDTVEITGTFRNVDENETFHDAELTANGEPVTTANVTVAGDSDGDHTFEWTPEEARTYDLSIDGIDAGTVEVTAPPTETASGSNAGETGDDESSTRTPADSNDGGGSSGGLTLPLIVVGILAVGSIGVLAGRRL